MKVEIQHTKLWATSKAALEGKFTALKSYITNEERSQISKLSSYLKKPGKKRKITLNNQEKKEIINTRAEINEMVNRKTREKISETKSRFLEKKSIKLVNF